MPNKFAKPARGIESAPSRLWYLAAVAVFVAGMAGLGIFLFSRLTGIGEGLVQVVVPGEMELVLDAGSYTIFHERRSVVDGHIYSADDIAGLGVTLASAAGEPVAITPTSMSSRYEFAGRSGAAAFEFEIGEPGGYLLSAAYREGTTGPETVLAVGKGFGGDILRTVLGAFALALTSIGLALAIGGKVFVKRRAARQASGGHAG